MLINCLAVGAGGFVGSVCRYVIGLIPALHKGPLPWQTLLVNVTGAVLIGIVVKYAELHMGEVSPQGILFLKVGICGGFTTFSTFALESAGLMQDGSHAWAVLYALLSVCLCVLGVFLGEGIGSQL